MHLHSALLLAQDEQRVVLDEQVQDKQQAKLQQQQAKVQDAQDIAAALAQHRLDEARSAAARRSAALATKSLMASQVCCCSPVAIALGLLQTCCSFCSLALAALALPLRVLGGWVKSCWAVLRKC